MAVRLAKIAFFIFIYANYATGLSERSFPVFDCNPLEGKGHIYMIHILYIHLDECGLEAFD